MVVAASEAAIESAIIGLLVVALIAAVVYFVCRAVGRADLGALGAAGVAIIGGILVLLSIV